MNKDLVINEIRELISECETDILPTKYDPNGRGGGVVAIGFIPTVDKNLYYGWHTKVMTFLNRFIEGENEFVNQIGEMSKHYYSNAKTCVSILNSIIEYIEKDFISMTGEAIADESIDFKHIFTRFHRVARQLRSRYADRTTLEIEDEYDVQDLLHALLRLFFDDVRAEEWTPSYAGKSARVDFLVMEEETVIEVKKTRRGLCDKEIGDQLIIDIDRYKSHPNCKKLICFVYDPEGRVGNPKGIIRDLEDRHDGFLEVYIEPSN